MCLHLSRHFFATSPTIPSHTHTPLPFTRSVIDTIQTPLTSPHHQGTPLPFTRQIIETVQGTPLPFTRRVIETVQVNIGLVRPSRSPVESLKPCRSTSGCAATRRARLLTCFPHSLLPSPLLPPSPLQGTPLPFTRRVVETVQVSIGLCCNQACQAPHLSWPPLFLLPFLPPPSSFHQGTPLPFSRRVIETVQGTPLPFTRRVIETVQVNIGLYCNQACQHCHVDSSPLRTEMMDHRTAERVVHLVSACPSVRCVDLTGGAPELNPEFRYLVTEARRMGKEVIDRCNLTVLFEPGQEDLAEFLAANQVHVVASLPCYSADNVNKQRGGGVFDLSIKALQLLNSLGYGKEGSGLVLDLVYNPVGPFLPPAQAKLEEAYKSELMSCYGISFNSLFTITNMPVKRFATFLHRQGQLEDYMQLLVSAFNPAAVDNVMCRNLINIDWQGALFDCDFNQQLNLGLPPKPSTALDSPLTSPPPPPPRSVFDIQSLDELVDRPIATAAHCYG
ncbi:unnamed protein product [Closterium sp. Naga37s-1]|nr:unnamed protein product [Closterium sp. Naga37s-1]